MVSKLDLTDKQRDVLAYIVRIAERSGSPPSGRQIARHFGYSSPNAAFSHLRALERKGFLRNTGDAWNCYAPTEAALDVKPSGLPHFGAIPAGPTWYAEDIEAEWISGIDDLFPNAEPGDFLLTVDGDSMIGAGLEPGMLALMRPNIVPKPRAICAVWVDGDGGTLKRVVPDGDVVHLIPENPDYKERVVGADGVVVQGVLQSALSITHFS